MKFLYLQERTTEDSKESESFKELLTARTHEFIEEVLTPHFGNMIMFVKDCEGVIERGDTEAFRHEESEFLLELILVLCSVLFVLCAADFIIEPQHEKTYLLTCAPNKDKPA